jgi:predicted GTPase
MRTIVIMGAAGRDFHDFNVVFRDDADTRVAAFTAAQIPGIENRVYPASLAGSRYPNGIPIRREEELEEIIREAGIDDVVLAYSDLSHEEVMRKASQVLAAGANFQLLGPGKTMLRASRPVIAVGAVRTGAGKSQTSRAIAKILLDSRG